MRLLRAHRLLFPDEIVFLSGDIFVLSIRVYPDEMLHCLCMDGRFHNRKLALPGNMSDMHVRTLDSKIWP